MIEILLQTSTHDHVQTGWGKFFMLRLNFFNFVRFCQSITNKVDFIKFKKFDSETKLSNDVIIKVNCLVVTIKCSG